MKTEITKIKLQLKDRSIELTAQEARDLQAELNDQSSPTVAVGEGGAERKHGN